MVYVLLADGFEEMEAVVPTDLLRRAGLETAFVALEELSVTGGHGITVTADLTLDEADAEAMTMLVLPGGKMGVDSIQMNLFAMGLIQTAFDRGCYVAAICAAPTLLAGLGLTDRRHVTCYPGLEEEMVSAVVRKGEAVVVSGRIVTGEAAGSAVLFGLKLVELLCGRETAERVKHEIHWHF